MAAGYNGSTFVLQSLGIGQHEGDLEHVTVRVDAEKGCVLEVFYAAHSNGEGKWVPSEELLARARCAFNKAAAEGEEDQRPPGLEPQPEEVAYEPLLLYNHTHPQVFVARNGHAR